VMPKDFSLDYEVMPTVGGAVRPELFLPLPLSAERMNNHGDENYDVLVRLKPGATITQAQVELNYVAQRLEQEFPKPYPISRRFGFSVRPLLEQAVKDGDPAIAAEASYYIGEGLRTAGQHDDAIEAYMTAAYVAPDTVWGRRGLLGAGRSFAALRQNDSAAIVYRKLLASSAGDSELESAARSGLKSIGQD